MSQDPPKSPGRRAVRIGKYEVVTHLATGGMGAVYRAIDTEIKRDVALKVLAPEMAAKPNLLQRFLREAASAARLKHENIVAIYEFGQAVGMHYLALEFVDGIDLYQHVRSKEKLGPEEARIILIQATRALQHAFEKGIVHRDIKPGNFMLTQKEGKPLLKMIDLGLALKVHEEENRLTRVGSTVGTADYMSPEQARNSGSVDVRSDIYSLGCTLFHMLAGRPPFHEGSLTDRIIKHINDEPPNVRDFNPAVPPELVDVLQFMLAKKPEDRFQTPGELLHVLEALGPFRTKSAPAPQPRPKPKSPPAKPTPTQVDAVTVTAQKVTWVVPTVVVQPVQGSAASSEIDLMKPILMDGRNGRKKRKRKKKRRGSLWLWFISLITLAILGGALALTWTQFGNILPIGNSTVLPPQADRPPD